LDMPTFSCYTNNGGVNSSATDDLTQPHNQLYHKNNRKKWKPGGLRYKDNSIRTPRLVVV